MDSFATIKGNETGSCQLHDVNVAAATKNYDQPPRKNEKFCFIPLWHLFHSLFHFLCGNFFIYYLILTTVYFICYFIPLWQIFHSLSHPYISFLSVSFSFIISSLFHFIFHFAMAGFSFLAL